MMTNYLEKRRKQKLYQQWMEKSGLPPENVPGVDDSENRDRGMIGPGIEGGLIYHLTARHFLYLLLIIAALLIIASILATILIMRSC